MPHRHRRLAVSEAEGLMKDLAVMNQNLSFNIKVGAAEELLKDLRVKSEDRGLNRKVQQMLWSLSPLLTFNMCGWYTLGYSSLLVLMNTVVTYLVIILQVGGQPVQTVPPSPDTGATSAPS